MIPIGYLYKRPAQRPDWEGLDRGGLLYSVSSCISEDFADYIQYWKHNGYWLFDSPQIMEELANNEGIDLSGATLFYYEAYETEFAEGCWRSFAPEPSFATNVSPPQDKRPEGFDVVTLFNGDGPECSPLSCNSLAESIPVNAHGLFHSPDEAVKALEAGLFDKAEPGPHRIIAVYTIPTKGKAVLPTTDSR